MTPLKLIKQEAHRPDPDTIKILDSIREELDRAKADYQQSPSPEKHKAIQFWQSKVDQYTARAEKRQS